MPSALKCIALSFTVSFYRNNQCRYYKPLFFHKASNYRLTGRNTRITPASRSSLYQANHDVNKSSDHNDEDDNHIGKEVIENRNKNGEISITTSILLLNIVAVIWGTQHSVIKMVVNDCDPSSFSFLRFIIAAIIVSPFTPAIPCFKSYVSGQSDSKGSVDRAEYARLWRWGLEMGVWMFLGYALQAAGLEFTTAQRSGFLLYLNVKLVPFFAFLLYGRKISIATWLSALAALTGTALLSYEGDSISFNVGDWLSIGAAGASAMFILRLETASASVKNSASLNSASLWTVAIASLFWNFGSHLKDNIDGSLLDHILLASQQSSTNVIETFQKHPLELFYLGGATTALCNYIQTRAQSRISAERAAIIYALDPVYGALFAFLLLGEQLSVLGFVGATLITIAAATNAVLDLGDKQKEKEYFDDAV